MTQTEALRLALEALVMLLDNYVPEATEEDISQVETTITAIKAALEAKDEETELEKDAVNLLFALHDAWPYVHQHCTIEANKKSIQALIVKHGDFADLHPPPHKRTWVGLTDEEYKELHLQMGPVYYYQDYGHAIEAKLKEKNT